MIGNNQHNLKPNYLKKNEKMKNCRIPLMIILVLGLTGCKKEEVTPNLIPKEINLTAQAPAVIAGNNEFGIELFTLVAPEEDENIMLSPLSASVALTMLLNGCGGDTYQQLKETLKYPNELEIGDINEAYKSLVKQLLEADPKVKIALANAIFYRLGFDVESPFLSTMSEYYDAHIEGLDFGLPSALATINGWASDNTYGKIPNVLDEIDSDAVMFLMNALYFKGDWSYQFVKSQTQNRPFYLDDGTSLNVSTMHGLVGAKYGFGANYQAIELPYGRTNFTMVVVVPTESLVGFYSSFNAETWNEITSSIDEITDYSSVEVFMPKFKFSFEKFLNEQLQSMGMVDAFIPFTADLSGISDASIYVNFVKQNAFVEVNEEGTEAAAVTTIGINLTSAGPSEPPVFVIDKPFIFTIRERTTNTLMFIGKIANPQE
jgi:serpin B